MPNKLRILLNRALSVILFMIVSSYVNGQSTKGLLSGSDEFLTLELCGDTTKYIYKNITIITIPKYDLGEYIIVKDSDSNVKHLEDIWAADFYGIVDDNLILDIGVSNFREFRIYKLPELTLKFSSLFFGRLSLDKKKIKYNYLFQPDEIFEKPNYEQNKQVEKYEVSVGYYQERIYNLKNGKLMKCDETKVVFMP